MSGGHTFDPTLASSSTQSPQPSAWPFPRLDGIQARNHQRCVESLRALEERRRQQALRECLASWPEAPL